METKILGEKLFGRNGLLYPMLVIAAVSVIIFSAFGVATMTGLLPRAESTNRPQGMTQSKNHAANADKACSNCGVIESINAVEVRGQGTGLGAVAGGVTGALLGNQIGHGRGRTAATVVGAGAGAYAGNEIEKNVHQSVKYQVRVRMVDGTRRTFYEKTQPAYVIGQKVRVTDQGVMAAG